MTEQRQSESKPASRRARRRIAAISAAAIGIVLVAGVGTASAADRRWWNKSHRNPGAPAPSRPGGWAKQPAASPSAPAKNQPSAPGATPSAPAGGGSASGGSAGGGSAAGNVALPPTNGQFDYQIGGAYQPPSGVTIVSRDRGDSPAAGKYNICYVNGFQTQPDQVDWWKANHDDLLLKRGGKYVEDSAWDELLLDPSTTAKREALATIVGGWIDQCASKGFNAVEVDNLDSWTRSSGLLSESDAADYAKLLAARSHAKGLAIGQKNASEFASKGKSVVTFDFAIAEECAEYTTGGGKLECQSYVDVYGDHVIVIEYNSSSFDKACSAYGSRLSIVLRDRDVTPGGVYRSC